MTMCGTVRAFIVLFLIQLWTTFVVAQFGMGFGGMGMEMGMNLNRRFGRNSRLGRAVRDIVHPDATPSQAMIDIAMRHRGPPATTREMQEYMPHMVLLAYQHGVKVNGTSPSLDVMNNYIMERGTNWMNRRGQSSDPPSETASSAVNSNQQNSATSVSAGDSYSTNNASTGSSGQPEVVVNSGNVASEGNVGQAQVAGSALPTETQSLFGYAVSTQPTDFLNDYMIMDMAGLDLGLIN